MLRANLLAPAHCGRIQSEAAMRSNVLDLGRLVSALVTVGVEVAILALVCGALFTLGTAVLSRATNNRSGSLSTAVVIAQIKARRILVVTFVLAAAGLLAYNAWL